MFDQPALNALPPPDHLCRVPESVVGHLAAVITSDFPVLHFGLNLDLRAFIESRSIQDGQRLPCGNRISAARRAG